MMTPLQIAKGLTEAVRALAPYSEAASSGEWYATSNAYGCNFVQRLEAGEPRGLICGGNNHDTLTVEDAVFIALCVNYVRALLQSETSNG